MRLTALYTGLFFTAGLVLILIVNALVRATSGKTVITKTDASAARLLAACKQLTSQGSPQDPTLAMKCKSAFNAGARLGATTQQASTTHDLLLYSIVALAATTVLAAVFGWIVSGRILRPVHAITAAARRASDQHLGERLALRGTKDELRELADTFDDMLDRLDRAFAAQRRFVANASHELRTPLTVMQTAIDVTLTKPTPNIGDYQTMATSVRTSVAEANQLIEALLTLARSEQHPDRTATVDLATACEKALAATVLQASDGTNYIIDADLQPAFVTGDPILLDRMVANLVDNAARYNIPAGVIQLRTATINGEASLTVSNTGPEIPDDDIAQLFEPFHRADARLSGHEGFGLGLSIVDAVAQSHDGTVSATARQGGGLIVGVVLPATHEAHAPDPLPAPH
jgi:signal transduction histidine kinase